MHIPVDAELVNHPRLRGLARDMGEKVGHTLGNLVCLWAWAIQYAEDGDLSSFDAEDIAEGSDIAVKNAEKWLSGLKKRGWITEDGFLHAWDRWAGKSLRSQRKDAERKRRYRAGERQGLPLSTGRPPDVHRTSTPEKEKEKDKDKEKEKRDCVVLPDSRLSLSDVLNLFNSICTTLPKASATEIRKKSFRPSLKETDIDHWKTVFQKANASDFISGRSGKWQGCSFDWFKSPSNRQKVIEGNYDNERGSGAQEPDPWEEARKKYGRKANDV